MLKGKQADVFKLTVGETVYEKSKNNRDKRVLLNS